MCIRDSYNCPGQIVISGSIEGINKACELMKAAGAKRALPLKVGGADVYKRQLILYIGTKVEDTMKLNSHWKATAMATAAPRMVFGKISAISTQQMGPQLNMNEAL